MILLQTFLVNHPSIRKNINHPVFPIQSKVNESLNKETQVFAYCFYSAYLLVVVEQPQQCRMSGYGEKDRRPIDPAPIVKLIVLNYDQDNIEE